MSSIHLVRWPGSGKFWLTTEQKNVISVLADASFHTQTGEVKESQLIRSGSDRIETLFSDSGLLGKVIVPGRNPGTYRITVPYRL